MGTAPPLTIGILEYVAGPKSVGFDGPELYDIGMAQIFSGPIHGFPSDCNAVPRRIACTHGTGYIAASLHLLPMNG